jgi:excisionase family DNA binding protein
MVETMQENKLTCSVEEAGKLLGVSRPTAYKLAHQEGFPVMRIGRAMRVYLPGFYQWIEERTKEGKQN